MAPLHFASRTELIKGLDGNYYSMGNSGELSSFDDDGNVALEYFKAYYKFSRPEFAISKDGDRAYISTDGHGGSRDMYDTVYNWSTNAHTIICFDSAGKVKWHRLITDVGFQNEAADHRARYDLQGNLYVATNFSKNTPGKSGLFSSGYRAIIYKYNKKGNLVGEFYDTTNIGDLSMSSEAWLYNDEKGRVNAVIYTFAGFDEQHYPNINLTAEESSNVLKVVFDSNFNVSQYYLAPSIGVPGNSMPSNKFCLFLKSNIFLDGKEYTLPGGSKINFMSDEDIVFMVFDSIGRPASTHKITNTSPLSIIPNPNNGNFKITLQNDQYKELNIKIHNANGQLIFNETTSKITSGEYNISLPQSTLSAGIYFISIKTDTGIQFQEKIIINSLK